MNEINNIVDIIGILFIVILVWMWFIGNIIEELIIKLRKKNLPWHLQKYKRKTLKRFKKEGNPWLNKKLEVSNGRKNLSL